MNTEKQIRLYYLFKFLQNAHLFGAVLVPFFTVWAGLNEQVVLLIQSWFMASVTGLELPTGIVADKYGRKISLVFGAAAATFGLILYGLFANIYLFLFCEFILAMAMSFISGAEEAWLIDTLNFNGYSNRKTEIIGKGQSFMFAGMIIGTIAGSFVASKISINSTMYLSAIPAFGLLLTALSMKEPKSHKAVGEIFRVKQGFLSLKELVKNPDLRYLSANLILVAVPAYFVIWLYQPFLTRAGVDIFWFGFIHSLFIGLEILISNRFGWFEKRLGLSKYLKLSALITTLGFVVLLINQNLVSILFFVLTAGSFGLTRRYFAIGKFHDYVDPTYRASITSAFSLLLRFSMAITNVFVGWMFVKSSFATLLILAVLPLVAVAFVPTSKRFEE